MGVSESIFNCCCSCFLVLVVEPSEDVEGILSVSCLSAAAVSFSESERILTSRSTGTAGTILSSTLSFDRGTEKFIRI